ncbi:MAG: hypothetical protein ORN23_01830 [Chthoniobacterales bacterium]|nr:hypothetical protein [Chthoniobacterales bacterium]
MKNLNDNSEYKKSNSLLDNPIITDLSLLQTSGSDNAILTSNVISLLFSEFRSLKELIKRDSNTNYSKQKTKYELDYNVAEKPRYLNQTEVISYLGHKKIFWILVDEYGLKPIRTEHKCNIYCFQQVDEKCRMFELNIAA